MAPRFSQEYHAVQNSDKFVHVSTCTADEI
jgi:hypothetical protein